jgi:hypothetical protein
MHIQLICGCHLNFLIQIAHQFFPIPILIMLLAISFLYKVTPLYLQINRTCAAVIRWDANGLSRLCLITPTNSHHGRTHCMHGPPRIPGKLQKNYKIPSISPVSLA